MDCDCEGDKCICQKNTPSSACVKCRKRCHLCRLCVPAIHLLEDNVHGNERTGGCQCFLSDSEVESDPQAQTSQELEFPNMETDSPISPPTNPETPGTSCRADSPLYSTETKPKEQPTKIKTKFIIEELDFPSNENLIERSNYASNLLSGDIKTRIRNLQLTGIEFGPGARNINENITERVADNYIKEDNSLKEGHSSKELEENSSRDVKDGDNSYGYAGDIDYSDDDVEKQIRHFNVQMQYHDSTTQQEENRGCEENAQEAIPEQLEVIKNIQTSTGTANQTSQQNLGQIRKPFYSPSKNIRLASTPRYSERYPASFTHLYPKSNSPVRIFPRIASDSTIIPHTPRLLFYPKPFTSPAHSRQMINNPTMPISSVSSSDKVDSWLRGSDFIGNTQNEEKSSSPASTSAQDLQFDEDFEPGRSDPPTSYRGRKGGCYRSNRAFEESPAAGQSLGPAKGKGQHFTANQNETSSSSNGKMNQRSPTKRRNRSLSKRKHPVSIKSNNEESTSEETNQNTKKEKKKSPKKRNKEQ